MYYLKKSKSGKKKREGLSAQIRKLDRVFSLYIRLRDSRPFGYRQFRCISCGMIKPFDQADAGHFIGRTNMATRFDEENVWCECRNCLTPDAMILTADLRWIPLGELCEGDELVGFSEKGTGKSDGRRRWQNSTITHIHRDYAMVYDVELENGDHIKTTAEHKWLVHSRGGYKWTETQELWINGYNIYGHKKSGPHTEKTTSIVCKPFIVCKREESYDAGWLAGMIDADGHICQQNIHDPDGTIRYGFRIGVAQSETYPYLCEKIIQLMEYYTGNHKPCRQWMENSRLTKIPSRIQTWQFLVTGTNVEKLQFLMRVYPMKTRKVNIDKIGEVRTKYDTKVKSITPLGKQEIVVMETSTHTFIANGYMMHNCNRFSSDHIIYYQHNLEVKLGKEKVEQLIVRGRSEKKWSAFELDILIKYYTARVEEMNRERGK